MVIGLGLDRLLRWVGSNQEASASVVQLSVTAMLLGWSALMASQLANVPLVVETRLILPEIGWMPLPHEVGLLPLLQLACLGLGGGLAGIALVHATRGDGERAGSLGRAVAAVALALYATAVLALILVG